MIKRRKKKLNKRLKPRIFGDLVAYHSLSLSIYIYVDKYILEIETANKLPA